MARCGEVKPKACPKRTSTPVQHVHHHRAVAYNENRRYYPRYLSLDDDEEAWREAVAKHEIKGVHLRVAGWGADVAKAYSISSLPSYYVVDAQGRIAERLRAVHDTQEIVAKIAESTKVAGG